LPARTRLRDRQGKKALHITSHKSKKKSNSTKKSTSSLLVAQALVRRFFGKKSFSFQIFTLFCERKVGTQNQIFKFFLEKN
jgi:hypothetical protein